METQDLDTDPPGSLPPGGRRSSPLAKTLAVILIAGGLVGSFLAGRGSINAEKPLTSHALIPPDTDCVEGTPCVIDPLPSKVALRAAFGILRGDGMTYGEWIRNRAERICPKLAEVLTSIRSGTFPSRTFEDGQGGLWIMANEDGPYTNGAWLWHVEMFVNVSCPSLQQKQIVLAGVWSDTGEAIPVSTFPPHSDLDEARRGVRHPTPSGESWLSAFLNGAQP